MSLKLKSKEIIRMSNCDECGKPFNNVSTPECDDVIQVRKGFFSLDNDFLPQEDVEYLHNECYKRNSK
jgi:hypothetical protein